MNTNERETIRKAIADLRDQTTVAEGKLASHAGTALDDLELLEALHRVRTTAVKLEEGFSQHLGASAILAKAGCSDELPRPKVLSQSKPGGAR